MAGAVSPPGAPGRLAVIGAGWAGLSAAVAGVSRGWSVTVLDMAPQPGGRARSLPADDRGAQPALEPLDNGQHILIGAYRDTLALMRQVGVDPERVLARRPLDLRTAEGLGLQLPAGHPVPAFLRGVLAARGWSPRERWGLLRTSAGWIWQGFRCPASWTVSELCAGVPARVRTELIEPLCVAALNTPSDRASASVFLRVLRDALFSGAGSSDLLIPRAPLGALLPEPALTWLMARGTRITLGRRVQSLQRHGGGWRVDDEPFDAVVVATPPREAARLLETLAPEWSATARAIPYEPIVTTVLHHPTARWDRPLIALQEGPDAPAQYAFDLGALGHPRAGCFSWVTSGASRWLERGLDALSAAVLRQATQTPGLAWSGAPTLVQSIAERRATFACTPGLVRPSRQVRGTPSTLAVAGDHVEGPYPATLEGAVRSGRLAVQGLG